MRQQLTRTGGHWQRWLPLLGGLLGLAALAWILRGFDLARFRTIAADADFRYIALVPLVVILEQVIRAWKWRQLLSPLRCVGTLTLFGAIMAGYLLATLIPFGFGTVARSWLVARRERDLKLASVLATVALDRITDGIVFACLVPVAVLSVAHPDPTGGIRAGLAWGGAGSLALLVIVLVGLELYRRQASNPGPWVGRLGSRLPTRFASGARRLALSFSEGINWPRDGWRGSAVVLASMAIKLLAALQFPLAGLAFGVELNAAQSLFLVVFLGFLVIVGHLLRLAGGFIIAAVFALGLFGVSDEQALAMALVVQAANLLTVALVGAVSLWIQGVAIADVRDAGESLDDRPSSKAQTLAA